MATSRSAQSQKIKIQGLGVFKGQINRVEIALNPEGFKKQQIFGGICGESKSHLLWKNREIWTPEHFLAARLFFENQVRIESILGSEFPILDGSAQSWFREFSRWLKPRMPKEISYRVSKSWEWEDGYLKVEPASEFSASVLWEKGTFRQRVEWKNGEDPKAILSARTFIDHRYYKQVLAKGYLRGGHTGAGILIDFESGWSSVPFRLANELAAHKLLDLWGDLAILGGLPKLKITIKNGSHFWNHALIQHLLQSRNSL